MSDQPPTPDPRQVLLSLNSEQIHDQLRKAEADAEALRVLLRAARARERIAGKTDGGKEADTDE
jgi:hypothetical protein